MGICPFGKINNNGGIHSNQRVLFDPYIYIKFCHTSNPPELFLYTKDITVEMLLKSAQNKRKRNKTGHFRSLG